MLSSLVNNNLHGWHIVVAVEPSKFRDEQLNLIKKFIPQAEVILNNSKLGVRENPFSVLNYVFEKLNSKVNIYLEEDIIISPDVCNLASWYFGAEEESACLCLCNSDKSGSKQINSTLFSPMNETISRFLYVLLKRKKTQSRRRLGQQWTAWVFCFRHSD